VRISTPRLLGLLAMIALALFTVWLERTVREDERHPSFRRHDPDYVIDNFTVTSFDRDGNPESTLAAAKMLHYPDDDTTELLAPRVVHSQPDRPRMTLNADRGALSPDGEEIFLFGNVLMTREAGHGVGAARVQTTFLHILRSRSLVRTDREVEITEAGRSLSGIGMEYSNETQQLVLHDRVRGLFEARKSVQ
jgi:lipopolysaccharide export system protein LptC